VAEEKDQAGGGEDIILSKKDICAAILGHTIFRLPLFCPPRGRLFILNYHRIRPAAAGWVTPFDDGVYDTDEEGFRRQVRWLQSRSRILREGELLEILQSGRFPAEPCSLITFDDGYADNHTRALPILRSERASAIFFIATGLISERRLGWWDLLAYAVKRSRRGAVEWQGQSIPLADRAQAIRRLQRIMKSRPHGETAGLVEEIARQCGVELPDAAEQGRELMSWSEIRDLEAQGMDIGAHTHSHRVLSTLAIIEEQASEIRRSKEMLESQLGRPIRSLAYPVGGPSSFSAETCRVAAAAGMELAFSYGPHINRWPGLNRHDIRRLPTPAGIARLAASTVLPRLFAR
jgi:peptidoglycan/xylan/chitin deacetylase (PgdA/CDA1 family)